MINTDRVCHYSNQGPSGCPEGSGLEAKPETICLLGVGTHQRLVRGGACTQQRGHALFISPLAH